GICERVHGAQAMDRVVRSPVIKLCRLVRILSYLFVTARQHDGNRKATADPVGGPCVAAQGFDVATYDPEAEARVLRPIVLTLVRARREVPLEDMLDLVGRNSRPFVVDLHLDPA